MAHELVLGYHKESREMQCSSKIDLCKVYASACWDFLEEILWGYTSQDFNWVMVYVET